MQAHICVHLHPMLFQPDSRCACRHCALPCNGACLRGANWRGVHRSRTARRCVQVPLVIKEALDVYGYPSTFGWNDTSYLAGGIDLFPLQNAAVVQLLLDAGAIIIGKVNIPPFSSGPSDANASWIGPTFNAVNPALKPGSSSTGTATAVAAGFAVWGMGEETGGSIQLPADAQSLVGLKTTCASPSWCCCPCVYHMAALARGLSCAYARNPWCSVDLQLDRVVRMLQRYELAHCAHISRAAQTRGSRLMQIWRRANRGACAARPQLA